jgi:sugar lactone lactonase YvrE
MGIAYDAAGNLYFADTNRNQIDESTLAGQLLVVAGSGVQGFSGDGGNATGASLNAPQGVAFGADGTLYIADTGNQRIRAVSSGQMTTFAGTGRPGFGGDGGLATAASFSRPTALAIDASGALLLCDSGNHRIRRILAGTVTTIAGTGAQGFGGDNGLATAAQLDTPGGIAVAADGRIFIADTHNHRVRVISAAGVVTTFAGNGVAGFSGDGGLATAAQLSMPQGLTMSAGSLVIADSNNQRVRSVDTQGRITTVAGNGVQGSSADGAVGASAPLDTPRGVALSAYAAPVFADTGNRAVRELVANGNLYLPAGLQPARLSAILITAVPGAVLGQPVVTATVQGAAGTPQGVVQLFDGGTLVAQQMLVKGVASFATAALTVGAHSLSAGYLGDGVNPAAVSAVVGVSVGRAGSVTTELQPLNSYAGLPLVLSANVTSSAVGTPTGVVSFSEGGTTVATGTLAAGSASGVYAAPSVGTHAIVANYAGDSNFTPSSSAPLSVVVGGSPDFTIASAGSATQTVPYSAVAVYSLLVASQDGPFPGAVSLSVAGLPNGVTAAFSPPQPVPGAGSVPVTLSLQVPATLAGVRRTGGYWFAMVLPLWFGCLWRVRKRVNHRFPAAMTAAILLGFCLLPAIGCGDRTLSQAAQPGRSFALIVTGTGTSLAGTALTHSTAIVLVVQ